MKTIQSIHRAIQILKLFSLSRPNLGISEMSRLTNLNQATVQGFVRTLLKENFLQQNQETRKYQLGIALYELGIVSAGSLEITQRASSPAHGLAKRTEQQVRVATFDKDSAIVILNAYPKLEPFIFRYTGTRPRFYCSALGKAILAFWEPIALDECLERIKFNLHTVNTITQKEALRRELEKIRQQGYALNREERLLGRAAIGAPIFGRHKQILAAICLVGTPKGILGESMEGLVMEVNHTALEISIQMGYVME